MKGQHTLFETLITEPDKAPKPDGYRPRNFHMPARDRCLAYRYYYYAQIHRMRYDDILKALEVEFYLTEHRLIAILTEGRPLLEQIIAEAPDHVALQRLYPHIVWRPKKS